MKIQVVKGDIREVETDVIIVGCLEDDGRMGGALKDLDEKLGGEVAMAFEAKEFTAKKNTTLIARTRGRLTASHVVVVGMGKKKELNIEGVRQAVGVGVKRAVARGAESVALVLIGAGNGGLNPRDVARAVTESVILASNKYDDWKKKDEDKKELASALIVEIQQGKINRAEAGSAEGETDANATLEARKLVNEPGQTMRPRHLKEFAERIAKLSPSVSVEVFNRAEAKKMGMTAFLAVAQGSDEEPYFIHLRYTPKKASKKSVALVGKGITFDSGGLSLKPSNAMTTMKMDMAGAAAVLGVFSAIDEIQPSVEVHGIVAACENMPSGSAYRPGDIVRAKNGLSIEVDNTDAEGRVTLADALTYAEELNPSAIIDLATLTGACVVALGEEITGLMTNNGPLAKKLFEAAEESGEEMWELPLFEGYNKLIESKVADVRNVGGRWGGALTAGLFLQKFVNEKTPWVHMDIAGPAYAERDYLSYVPYGGTGAGVRTLLRYLRKLR